MADLLAHAFARDIAEHAASILPTKIYMAGHFTRVDMPSFSDFKATTHLMSVVRNKRQESTTSRSKQFVVVGRDHDVIKAINGAVPGA